jgi:hypothetical protein
MATFDDSRAPLSLRVGDAERAAAVTRLSDAYASDYLSEVEFERRVALVYQAAVADDLTALMRDLPQGDTPIGRADHGPPALPARRISALLSSIDRSGADVMPPLLEIEATLASIELDLTQATFLPGVTEIRINARLASIEIDLPGDVQIILETAPTLSSVEYDDLRPANAPPTLRNAPIVRITGTALLSSVEVDQYLV